jgi:RNA processing factor Prp31
MNLSKQPASTIQILEEKKKAPELWNQNKIRRKNTVQYHASLVAVVKGKS